MEEGIGGWRNVEEGGVKRRRSLSWVDAADAGCEMRANVLWTPDQALPSPSFACNGFSLKT